MINGPDAFTDHEAWTVVIIEDGTRNEASGFNVKVVNWILSLKPKMDVKLLSSYAPFVVLH